MTTKNRSMALGILTILAVLTLGGCTEDNQNNPRYINTNYGFEIMPPTGWTTNENTLDPVKFFCPDKNDYQINLAVKAPLTSNETLSTLVDQLIEKYSTTFFKNFTLISSNHTTINGLDAYELVYSEGQLPYMLQHKQVFFGKNNTIFTVIYTSLVTTYETYISVVDESISTFTVI
jgi:hypothetical protein